MWLSYLLLIIAALCNSLAQASIKQATIGKSFTLGFNQESLYFIVTTPLIWIGLLFYFVAFFLSIKVFEKLELSFASPVFMALVFLLVFILGGIFFKETITANKIIGAIVILAGVLILTRV